MKFFNSRSITIVLVLVTNLAVSLGQKPILDTAILRRWPDIPDYAVKVSDDGNFVLYSIYASGKWSTVVWYRNGNRSREIPNVLDASFTADNRHVIFVKEDSMRVLDLSTGKQIRLGISSVYKVPDSGDGRWFAYQTKARTLVLYDFATEKSEEFSNIDDFKFNRNGTALCMQGSVGSDSTKIKQLKFIDLVRHKTSEIWHGHDMGNLSFVGDREQILFWGKSSEDRSSTSVFFYKTGMDSAVAIVKSRTTGMPNDFCIAPGDLSFSPGGGQLFFFISRLPKQKEAENDNRSVNIWSYQDEFVKPDQPDREQFYDQMYRAVFNFQSDSIYRLQFDKDAIGSLNVAGGDDYYLTESMINGLDSYRLLSERPDFTLVNTHNGSRRVICKKLLYQTAKFSAGGKYVCWFDRSKKAYFTYSLADGIVRNISQGINRPITIEDAGYAPNAPPYGEPFWSADDQSFFVYDRYDVWSLDPSNRRAPMNVTRSYGRSNKIMLRAIYAKEKDVPNGQERAVIKNGQILLCAFDEMSKDNGFFRLNLLNASAPERLCMLPKDIYFSNNGLGRDFSTFLLRSKNRQSYVFKEMSASDFPNLKATDDFVQFQAISNLRPEKNVNWLSSQLKTWKTFEGKKGEGIIYKPENFDSARKYPAIIYIYEELSPTLNKFISPELSFGPMNIPWFVSHGYVVFCPDIWYKVGDPGSSVYDYVVSAAEMLKEIRWIDSAHIGIQGHSFGGSEVNFLITKTNAFAAAVSAAGVSDYISAAGSLAGGTMESHGFVEDGQDRMGKSIWDDPDAYFRNSPIFGASKVTTPLLIMHNKDDANVPWSQGVEFFTGLRRLGKKVWMLQYDNEIHITLSTENSWDYTKRMEQFFDHYLKDKPAPKWMTESIPAYQKGYYSGLELND